MLSEDVKKKSKYKVLWQCLIIFFSIFLVEVFAFNYKAFLNPGTEQDFEDSSLRYSGLKKDGNDDCLYVATSSHPEIATDIQPGLIKTLYFDCEFSDSSYFRLESTLISNNAATGNTETLSQAFELVNGDEQTKYLETSFSSPSSAITIRFDDAGNGASLIGAQLWIKGLSVNKRIPFQLSFARVLALAVPAYLIYLFVYLFVHRKEIFERIRFSHILRCFFYGVSFALVLIVFAVFGNFSNLFLRGSGSQVSQELVDAFLSGHVYLSTIPEKALLALANPYDPKARAGIYYLWDHLLYNGRYYSYYGVTPVFLFFLPMHVLTGQYVDDAYGVLIFSLIATVFMALGWQRLLKAFFPQKNLPLFLEIGGYGILFFCSGVLTNLERPSFYECATSCAFMCMMIAVFFLACSGLFDKERNGKKANLVCLFFGSFWIALAVLSRATTALYAIAFLIWVLHYALKNRTIFDKRYAWAYGFAALSPLFVFGLLQCAYNFIRFGNPLDFGIEYSLTIADFLHMPFHFTMVLTSVWNFFFSLPRLQSDYYFLAGTYVQFGNGNYFFESQAQFGLFARLPLLFGVFVFPFLRKRSWQERGWDFLLYFFPCVIVPFILVGLTWQSGYATRYFSDFAWIMVLYVLFLFFDFYLKGKEAENVFQRKKWLSTVFIGSLIFTLMANFGLINMYVPEITQFKGATNWSYTVNWLRIGRELTFWR